MFFAKPNHDIIRQHFTIKITLYILRMFFSGFINAAKLFNDHKVVALMMFACGGLFVVNALLEIILLRKVCIITNVFWDHIFFLDLDFFFFLDNFTIFFVMSLSGLWKTRKRCCGNIMFFVPFFDLTTIRTGIIDLYNTGSRIQN